MLSDFVARPPLFLYVHPDIIWSSTEEKLRFLEPIEDNETQEKKTISFVCKVNRPGATVRWLKAGQEVTLSKRIVYRVDGLKHSLTIKDCIMEDEGEYTAVVGDDKCAAELIISEAPTDFTAQLKDQTITEFEDAEFTCKLSKEKAAVKWYREGREIRAGPRYDRSASAVVSIQRNTNQMLKTSTKKIFRKLKFGIRGHDGKRFTKA